MKEEKEDVDDTADNDDDDDDADNNRPRPRRATVFIFCFLFLNSLKRDGMMCVKSFEWKKRKKEKREDKKPLHFQT